MGLNRPRVQGTIVIEKRPEGLVARASLELEGSAFHVNGRLVDTRDHSYKVEYSFRIEPGRYYHPLITPLPRPPRPYTLIEYSLVYVLDPRYNIVHTPFDSTTVLTRTKYVLSEGLGYPQLYVYRDSIDITGVDEALWAYPLIPSNPCLASIVKLEYKMLLEHAKHPSLSSIRAYCYTCDEIIEKHARRLLQRASYDIAELASRQCVKLEASRIGELNVNVEAGVVRVKGFGLLHVCVECGSTRYTLSRCVAGEDAWRIDKGCEVRGYSYFCPCL